MSPPASLQVRPLEDSENLKGQVAWTAGKRPFYNRQMEMKVCEDQCAITVNWESGALVPALCRLLCDLNQSSLPLWCSFPDCKIQQLD